MSEYKLKIPHWPVNERPRERLYNIGASNLSDTELLAILIGKGTKDKTAVDIAKELLVKYKNLSNLSTRDLKEFATVKGMGTVKATILSSAFEVSRRLKSKSSTRKSFALKSPQDVWKFYHGKFSGLKIEVFRVAILNSKNHLLKDCKISEGILNASIVHPREVFREAILESAASIITVHNHPSGNPDPSDEDIKITKQLIQAGKIIGITLLDHVIVTNNSYKSLSELGII